MLPSFSLIGSKVSSLFTRSSTSVSPLCCAPKSGWVDTLHLLQRFHDRNLLPVHQSQVGGPTLLPVGLFLESLHHQHLQEPQVEGGNHPSRGSEPNTATVYIRSLSNPTTMFSVIPIQQECKQPPTLSLHQHTISESVTFALRSG